MFVVTRGTKGLRLKHTLGPTSEDGKAVRSRWATIPVQLGISLATRGGGLEGFLPTNRTWV